jgi:hypothetical protein
MGALRRRTSDATRRPTAMQHRALGAYATARIIILKYSAQSIDIICKRLYEYQLPVSAHAPQGRAFHPRSPASTSTRANSPAAVGPGPRRHSEDHHVED